MVRHEARKNSCVKEIACARCNKQFKKACNLARHKLRKIPCVKKGTVVDVDLKLKLEILKEENKMLELKERILVEENKKLEMTRTTNNITINNTINIKDFYQSCDPITNLNLTATLATALINSLDTNATIQNIYENQFAKTPGDRCIKKNAAEGYDIYSNNKWMRVSYPRIKMFVHNVLDNHVNNIQEYENELSTKKRRVFNKVRNVIWSSDIDDACIKPNFDKAIVIGPL